MISLARAITPVAIFSAAANASMCRSPLVVALAAGGLGGG